MKIAIMQPYWFPYIGYWQLAHAVDAFVIYDNIQYTKKGWFNRNRFLQNGTDAVFTLPLRKGNDMADVCEREVAESFDADKLIRQFENAYRKAPFCREIMPLLKNWIDSREKNLFQYIHASIAHVSAHLTIQTPIIISSTLAIDHTLRADAKVKAICAALQANVYINSIGGQALYDKSDFARNGIDLRFLSPRLSRYEQFGSEFVPGLSIIDVLMFNSCTKVREFLDQYDLV
jgi:hypothetical protein